MGILLIGSMSLPGEMWNSGGSDARSAKASVKRAFIIDDHPALTEGVAKLLSLQDDLEVGGYAVTAAEARQRIAQSRPDIVILDLSLPDQNGLDLLKELVVHYPELPVLVFSGHDESLYARRVIRAGGKGFLRKEAPTADLLIAIRAVLNGKIYLSDAASRQSYEMHARRSGASTGLNSLSDRELELFELIGTGCTLAQVAEKMGISPKTADAHRSNIRVKLGYNDSVQLMRDAVLWVERGETTQLP